MNEQEKFLEEFNPKNESILDHPLVPEEKKKKNEPEEKPESEPRDNRQVRRLKKQLEEERESSKFIAGKLEALTESQKFRNETESNEYLKRIERIYGTNSPEAQEATKLLAEAFEGVEKAATQKALELFREEQRQHQEAESQELKALDTMVEEIEEEYNVTLDESTQKGFFTLLERLS